MAFFAAVDMTLNFCNLAGMSMTVSQEPLPPVPDGLEDKGRWMQATIKNETELKIKYLNSHFDSGEYYVKPTDIEPYSQMVYSACTNGFMKGCAGGTAFQVLLGDDKTYDFALGWTAPYMGSFKASALPGSRDAKHAYDSADDSSGEVTSKTTFTGKDKDGNDLAFKIVITFSPGREPVYSIKQKQVPVQGA